MSTDLKNQSSVSQYRSIIFYRNENQKKTIDDVLSFFIEEKRRKITTQVEFLDKFYEAEARHQDYYGVCRVDT